MALRTPLTVSPHEYFGDATGRPLDYGTIYFGEPDKDPEFYPIDVYSDEALTQPIPQPIRTKGGFINVNGDIIEIYGRPAIYSVKVLDQYGRKIFYKGKAMRNNANDDIIAEIDAAIKQSKEDGVEYAKKAVKDAINKEAIEGGEQVDTFVVVTPKFEGAIARNQSDKNSELVNIKDFGAIGDGVADDTDAIKVAIESGLPLDWGDSRSSYKVSNFIDAEIVKDVHWKSNGASIAFETTSHKNLVIRLNLNGCNFTSIGKLHIDAHSNAQSGFLLLNKNDKKADVLIEHISVSNIHKKSGFTFGGDGINIRGNFGQVLLNKPSVKNVRLGKDAGVSGSSGVSGITVMHDLANVNYKPDSITINDPHIEDVYSDDLLYFYDQDGIKVFTNLDNPTVTKAKIMGGTFKDCYGRSVKSQCEDTLVDGCHFVRTKGLQLLDIPDGLGVNLNPEVDFQYGGGMISNCTYLYDGNRPYGFCKTSPMSHDTKKNHNNLVMMNNISGITINQPDSKGMQYFVFTHNDSTDYSKYLTINDVVANSDKSSTLKYFIQTANTVNSRIYGNVRNVSADLLSAFFKNQGASGVVDLDYFNIRNTADREVPFFDTSSLSRVEGSFSGLYNFEKASGSLANSAGKKPLLPRVPGLLPTTGYAGLSGAMGIQSHFIADGEEVVLDDYGTKDNMGIVVMHVAYVVDSAAIFSTSSSSLSLMSSVDATRINIATNNPTQKPTSGFVRVYLKDGKTTVSNHSGGSRVFTFITLG